MSKIVGSAPKAKYLVCQHPAFITYWHDYLSSSRRLGVWSNSSTNLNDFVQVERVRVGPTWNFVILLSNLFWDIKTICVDPAIFIQLMCCVKWRLNQGLGNDRFLLWLDQDIRVQDRTTTIFVWWFRTRFTGIWKPGFEGPEAWVITLTLTRIRQRFSLNTKDYIN